MKNPALRRLRLALAGMVFCGVLVAFLDFRGIVPERWTAVFSEIQFVPSMLRGLAGAGVSVIFLWLLLTLLVGRVYCSAICPLGILQDVIWWARRRIFPKRLKFVRAANLFRYGVFLFVVAAGFSGVWVVVSLLDPYSLFGRIASGVFLPVTTGLNNLLVRPAEAAGIHQLFHVPQPAFAIPAAVSLVLLAGLVVLVAWRGRLFCNTICPVGTFLGFLSKHSLFRLEIDRSACEKCGDCLHVCKAECIDLKSQEIDFSRCVACYDCVSACDKGGIAYRRRARPQGNPDSPIGDPALRRGLGRVATGMISLALAPRVFAKGKDHGAGEHPRRKQTEPPMPPGAVSLERFLSHCTACGLCIANCPTQTLQPAFLEYGWRGIFKPRIDPEAGYCNFECTRCIDVCPTGALVPISLPEKQRTQIGEAHFHKRHCIVHTDGTDCAACSEHCPTKAVDTVPYRGNLLLPRVNEELCIGCGACEFACPVRPERAIRVSGKNLQTSAAVPAKARTPKRTVPNDFPF